MKTEEQSTIQSQNGGSNKNGSTNETTNEDQETPDATKVEKGGESNAETQDEEGEIVEQMKIMCEEEGQSIVPAPASDLHPSSSSEEERVSIIRCPATRQEADSEAITSSTNPDVLHHPIQKPQLATRGSHLSKRDKKIIEKIRSYYEAAAEADEDETEEEDKQVEGIVTRRRNSFSQIPSGLVKESVSRFDVGGRQVETQSGLSETTGDTDKEPNPNKDPFPPSGPVSSQTLPSVYAEKDEQGDQSISSLDPDADGSFKLSTSIADVDKDIQRNMGLDLVVGEETGIQDTHGSVCNGPLEAGHEEMQEVNSRVESFEEQEEAQSITKEGNCKAETATIRFQADTNSHESNQTKQNGNQKETSTPVPPTEQCQKPEIKTQSTWTRTKHRDMDKTSGNLEELSSHIKVGRWSRHSKIVTANRALFEGMGSDVAGISLFEASPAVDPVLMENSERILSKVQTLARMYSAKASTMKVPLHHKRCSTVRKQSWSTSRLEGHSTQTETKIQTQAQSQTQLQSTAKSQQQTQCQMDISQSHTHTDTKTPLRLTTSECGEDFEIQAKNDETKTMSREDPMIQEERNIKREENLANGRFSSLG